MEVQTVGHPPRHDVDPAIGHPQSPATEVPFQRLRIGPHMPVNQPFQFGERGGNGVQPINGAIRRIPSGVILFGPLASGLIEITKLMAFPQQLTIKHRPIGPQSRAVNERRKPSFNPFHRGKTAPEHPVDETFSATLTSDSVILQRCGVLRLFCWHFFCAPWGQAREFRHLPRQARRHRSLLGWLPRPTRQTVLRRLITGPSHLSAIRNRLPSETLPGRSTRSIRSFWQGLSSPN